MNVRLNYMPYQYKREPLNNDEVDKLTNACGTFREKFVIWALLDTGLKLSEFADLKKENIQ
jgi:integrase/recombinase XerD